MEHTEDFSALSTEQVNPATARIDRVTTLEMVQMINEQDKLVALAVERALPSIAQAVDCIANGFEAGGRLVYVGAGTSGRLGILDASESVPTFGVPVGMVVGLIAGGAEATTTPVEGAEDNAEAGKQSLDAIGFNRNDVLVGIAASGRTPYVIGAMDYARRTGARVIALSCVKGAAISAHADISIEVVTGPEVISGSTRMKAGTAQKMVLNILSTGAMIKSGKVYRNLMVDVVSTNEKLVERALRLTCEATGVGRQQAAEALHAANNSVKLAVLMLKTGLPAGAAVQKLTDAQGHLRRALTDCGVPEND